MAYRRRQGITKTSTFTEEIHHPPPPDYNNNDLKRSSSSSSSSSSGGGGGGGTLPNSTSYTSLAAQAIRASAVHRESSLSSAYADSAFPSRPSKVPFFLSFFLFQLSKFNLILQMGPRFLLKDLFVCVLFWIESLIWGREGILCILFPRLLCWTPAPVF